MIVFRLISFCFIFVLSGCLGQKSFKIEATKNISHLKENFEFKNIVNKNIIVNSYFLDINNKPVIIDAKEITSVLFQDNNWIVVQIENSVLVYNRGTKEQIIIDNKEQNILSFVINNNDTFILTLLDVKNKFSVYSLKDKKLTFSKQEKNTSGMSSKIATFQEFKHNNNNYLIIPFLNGKLSFYDIKNNIIKKEFKIDYAQIFSNFNYLSSSDSLFSGHTKHKVFIGNFDTFKSNQDLNIKDSILDKKNIYLIDINGYIYLMDKELNILKKELFRYANFSNIFLYKNYIFAYEKSGYFLKFTKGLELLDVYFNKDFKKAKIRKISNKMYLNNHSFNLEELLK